MKKTWKKLLVGKMWQVTKFNIIQMNLQEEDMKYKTAKIFNLVENLLQKN